MSQVKDERHSGTGYWQKRWNKGLTGFHKSEVHPVLEKHFNKLFPDGTANKVFFPLCGKSVDMKWLADKNIPVVGVDCVPEAAEQFFAEQGLEFSKEKTSKIGEAVLYKDAAEKVLLYCCDMMKFDEKVEGTFDAVWDRGSLVALNREDVPGYTQIIKKLLKPGGRCLLETMDYDISIMNDVVSETKSPPPFPMYESDVKKLYEPECSVELLDRQERLMAGKDIHTLVFLITKKAL